MHTFIFIVIVIVRIGEQTTTTTTGIECFLQHFRLVVTISMAFYLFYSLYFLLYETGSTFNFLSLRIDSFLYHIYGHWIKSLLLLAINKYHSINARNESNEMRHTHTDTDTRIQLSTVAQSSNRFHASFIRHISFKTFSLHFRIYMTTSYDDVV